MVGRNAALIPYPGYMFDLAGDRHKAVDGNQYYYGDIWHNAIGV